MRLFLLFFMGPIGIFLIAIGFYAIPLPGLEPFDDARTPAIIGITLILIAGFFVLLGLEITRLLTAPLKIVDAAFIELGFEAKGSVLIRTYRGTFNGQPVQATYHLGRVGYYSVLNIRMPVPTQTQAAIGWQGPFFVCGNCPRQVVGGLPEGLIVQSASAPTWLYTQPVQQAVATVFDRGFFSRTTDLYIQPNEVWLRVHLQQMDAEILRATLSALQVVALAVREG